MGNNVPVLKTKVKLNNVKSEDDNYVVIGNQKISKATINKAKSKGYTDDEINEIIRKSNTSDMHKDMVDHTKTVNTNVQVNKPEYKQANVYAKQNVDKSKNNIMQKYGLSSEDFDKEYNKYYKSDDYRADVKQKLKDDNVMSKYYGWWKRNEAVRDEQKNAYGISDEDFDEVYNEYRNNVKEERKRLSQANYEKDKEYQRKHPYLSAVEKIFDNVVLRPGEAATTWVASLLGADVDEADYVIKNRVDAINEAARESQNSEIAKVAYDLASGGVDMAAQMATGTAIGNTKVMPVIQTLNTGGDTKQQALSQGNSNAESNVKSLLAMGLAYPLASKGLDTIITAEPKSVAGKVALGALTEGAEEGLESIGDKAIDYSVSNLTGSKSDIDVKREQVREAHPEWTNEQVNNEVFSMLAKEIGTDAAAGAFFGAGFGAADAIGSRAKSKNIPTNATNVKTDAEIKAEQPNKVDILNPSSINAEVNPKVNNEVKATTEAKVDTNANTEVNNTVTVEPEVNTEVDNTADIDALYNDFIVDEQASGLKRNDNSDMFKSNKKSSQRGYKPLLMDIINNSLTAEQKVETKQLKHELSMAINDYVENPTKANYDSMMEYYNQMAEYVPEYDPENAPKTSTHDGNEFMTTAERPKNNQVLDIAEKYIEEGETQNNALEYALEEVIDSNEDITAVKKLQTEAKKYLDALKNDISVEDIDSGISVDADTLKLYNRATLQSMMDTIVNHNDVAMAREFNDAMAVIKDRNSSIEEKSKAWTDLYDKYNANENFNNNYAEPMVNAFNFINGLKSVNAKANIPTQNTNIPVQNTNVPTQNTVNTTQNLTIPDEQIGHGKENIRGYIESVDMPDEILSQINARYNTLTNKETIAKANEVLSNSKSLTEARSKFDDMIGRHEAASVPLGYEIAKQYIDAGEHSAAVDIIDTIAKEMTKSGQFSQAAYITALRNDPMAVLTAMEKELDRLNKYGNDKFGKKWNEMSLTKEEVEMLRNLPKGDSKAIQDATDAIYTRLAEDYPHTRWEQVYEFMKTNMLFNPRTHIRNTAANAVNVPVRSLSDRVKAVEELLYSQINKDYQRTSSLTGGTKKQKSIAKDIFENIIRPLLEGSDNRYIDSARSKIEEKSQMYKTNIPGLKKGTQAVVKAGAKTFGKGASFFKSLDRITNGKVNGLGDFAEKLSNIEQSGYDVAENKVTGSALENLRRLDYWMLGDLEDTPFVKINFVNSLANYMKANNINSEFDVPQEAITMAYDEALKATFKDDNKFTKMLSNTKRDWGKLGDISLFFTKTPANLAMRAVDYSPAGLVNTVKHNLEAKKANNGKLTNEDISLTLGELSKNLTGSGMIAAGILLAKSGLITGTYSDDEDEKAWQQMNGFKENAIHIGDTYYTYDWSQPASTPLVIGTAIWEGINANDKDNNAIVKTLSSAAEGGKNAFNTWVDMSPLNSLRELLGKGSYGNDDFAGRLVNTASNALGTFVPALAGATARALDTNVRQTKDKTSGTNTFINQQLAKLPGASETLPKQYDALGREVKRTDGDTDFFNQYINPGTMGYASNEDKDVIDYLSNLATSTNNSKVYPKIAGDSVTVGEGDDKETIKFNNKQKSEYQYAKGRQITDMVRTLSNAVHNSELTGDEQVAVLDTIYNTAKQVADHNLYGKKYTMSNEALEKLEQGNDVYIQYLIDKQMANRDDLSYSKYMELKDKPTAYNNYIKNRDEAKELTNKYGINVTEGNVQDAIGSGMTPEQWVQQKVSMKGYNEKNGTDLTQKEYDSYKEKGATDKEIVFLEDMKKKTKGTNTDFKVNYMLQRVSSDADRSRYLSFILPKDTLESAYYTRGKEIFGNNALYTLYSTKKDFDKNKNGTFQKKEYENFIKTNNIPKNQQNAWKYVMLNK